MWHAHEDCGPGRGRRGPRAEWPFGDFGWGGRRRRGPWGGRMFEQGDLKYAILQLLAENPPQVQDHQGAGGESGASTRPRPGGLPTLTCSKRWNTLSPRRWTVARGLHDLT
jgi:hypothetical protein